MTEIRFAQDLLYAVFVTGGMILAGVLCIATLMALTLTTLAYGTSAVFRLFGWVIAHFRGILITAVAVVPLTSIGLWHWYFYLDTRDIPDINQLIHYAPAQIGRIYDRRDEVMIELGTTFRQPVDYSQVSIEMEHAIVAAEDKNFYEHDGVDWAALVMRVPLRNLLAWLSNRHFQFVQGGSTLTMQLVRNHYLRDTWEHEDEDRLQTDNRFTRWLADSLGAPRTNRLVRKTREIKYALHLERQLRERLGKQKAKELLLARHLSAAYFGHGMYGPDSASRFFFNKPVGDLTSDEAALLASFAPAPSRFAVLGDDSHMTSGQKRRRDVVLRRMGEKHFLYTARDCGLSTALRDRALRFFRNELPRGDCRDEVSAAAAKSIFIVGRFPGGRTQAPASVQMALDEIELRGFRNAALQEGKIAIHTTVDMRIQRIVNMAAKTGLENYRALYPNQRTPQLAVVVLGNKDARVLAQNGGSVGDKSRNTWTWFDRSRKSLRQPGSGFKPFVYLSAFRTNGYTPDSLVFDGPFSLRMGNGQRKEIHNYDGLHQGLIPLREAFAQSRNVPAMRVALNFTTLDDVISTARMCGIMTPLRHEPSTALGASEVTLIELTNAFRSITSNGIWAEPYIISHIDDSFGRVLFSHREGARQIAADPTALRYTQELLRGTVRLPRGTAHTLDARALGVPLECKTGTSNDEADARMTCSTHGPDGITVGIWMGRDEGRITLGDKATGGRLLAPLMRFIFKEAYRPGLLGQPPPVPDDIEKSITEYIANTYPRTAPK